MGTVLFSCKNENNYSQTISEIKVVDYKSEVSSESNIDQKIDSLEMNKHDEKEDYFEAVVGAIPVVTQGFIIPNIPDEGPISCYSVEHPPEFKGTPPNLSPAEKLEYLSDSIQKHIKKYFVIETFVNLELEGRQRIYAQFTINEEGMVEDIKTRAPHPELEVHIRDILEKLPELEPALHQGEPRVVVYSIPIIFQTEPY
jgi:hypothetical protein